MLTLLHHRPNGPFAAYANSSTRGALRVPQIHTHAGDGCFWTWDEPLKLLSVTVDAPKLLVSLPMESLQTFVTRVDELTDPALAALTRALESASRELDVWSGNPPWPLPLREAIGFLLMYVLAEQKAKFRRVRLQTAARSVVERLPPESPSGAWRVAFQTHLPYAHRAGVLAAAAADGDTLMAADLVWWTAKCRLDLAIEWAETRPVEGPEALHELTEAVSTYLHLLQNDPSRRSMESFYAAAGTTAEREVLRALAAREELTTVDELLRADVMTWLLRRYSLVEAWRLLRQSLRPSEIVGGVLAAVLAAIGIVLFIRQTMPRFQIFVQVSAFMSLVFVAPRLFSLMLPRAMFGTLLAWITVVLAQSASLLPIASDTDHQVREACHMWLKAVLQPGQEIRDWFAGDRTPPAIFDFTAIVAACLTISVVFLMVEVSNRLSRRILGRSIYCILVMLIGSMFWGAMLVPTLQYIVAREPIGTSCGCIYPAWILGSVCAVAFGILVQLMWDDHAVSDSFGLSLDAMQRRRV